VFWIYFHGIIKGVFITPERRYERNNFIDRQLNDVLVEVAGGMCDKKLGTSTIKVEINGCSPEVWDLTLQQGSVARVHQLPAHVLDLLVEEVATEEKLEDGTIKRTKIPVISDFFAKPENNNKESIDLRKIEKDKSEEGSSEETEETEKKVRFQYDGELKMKVLIAAGFKFPCTQWHFFKDDHTKTIEESDSTAEDSEGGTYSFHLVETLEQFEVRVEVFYELQPGLTCSIVSPDTMIRLTNKVGVDQDFRDWELPEAQKLELSKCSQDTGCREEVQHDSITGDNAHVVKTFTAGRPNIFNDHRKDFYVQALNKDNQVLAQHTAYVVVTGEYLGAAQGKAIALPEQKPIMILRDPPGGLSTATYENVETCKFFRAFLVLVVLEFQLKLKHAI
jgi:hypothetical protein